MLRVENPDFPGYVLNLLAKLQLTCPLNRYPQAHLGVIQEGAYADILLIDGNTVEDLLLLMDKDNIPVIMKDGKPYKNALLENRANAKKRRNNE